MYYTELMWVTLREWNIVIKNNNHNEKCKKAEHSVVISLFFTYLFCGKTICTNECCCAEQELQVFPHKEHNTHIKGVENSETKKCLTHKKNSKKLNTNVTFLE